MSFHCAAVLATEAAALDSGIAWAERAGGGPGAGAPQQGAQPMKLKHLEAMLGDVAPFARPKVELEQYPTSAHIAAQLLFAAEERFGDVAGRVVVDLGCGTGMLAIGASLLGAAHVVGVDVDADALAIAADNVEENYEDVRPDGPLDLVRADVRDVSRLRLCADTVVMNPPFGTRRAGADVEFLQSALTGVKFLSGASYRQRCPAPATPADAPVPAVQGAASCTACTRRARGATSRRCVCPTWAPAARTSWRSSATTSLGATGSTATIAGTSPSTCGASRCN